MTTNPIQPIQSIIDGNNCGIQKGNKIPINLDYRTTLNPRKRGRYTDSLAKRFAAQGGQEISKNFKQNVIRGADELALIYGFKICLLNKNMFSPLCKKSKSCCAIDLIKFLDEPEKGIIQS